MLLWKGLCQNKLLAKVDLVLFLNKCDILQRKLETGVRLARYVKSYDDRPNDMDTASKCASRASYNVGSHVDCIRNTRLPRKIQRHTKNVFAGTQEVLWLLHIYHCEIYS